jgi:hypothetical protein
MKYRLISIAFVVLLNFSVQGQTETIYSPNKNVKAEIRLDSTLNATIFKAQFDLVKNIQLGLSINDADFNAFTVIKKKKSAFSDVWKPVFGTQSEILNEYNELILSVVENKKLKRQMNIVFRVYNDGVAIRYEIPKQSAINNFVINSDLTSFEVAGDNVFWVPNGEKDNIGPVRVADDQKEGKKGQKFSTPMVFETADKTFLAVHEAASFDFSYALLKPNGKNRFQFDIEPSIGSTPAQTAWRVFMIGDKAGSLLESNILCNLNPPCAIKDVTWIKPGIAFEDWRGIGACAGDFTYGANQESYIRYIDFAAEKGIEYVIFSAWWLNTTISTFSGNGFDMRELIKYAEGKGIGIFLYIDRKRKTAINDWELEDVLKAWQQWGVKGIKYGFLGGECKGRQALVRKTSEIVELCAKHRMMVDFHDHPVPPSGDSRTWPNLITREYCHSQSDARKAFGPKTFVTSALVNGIAGSLDMGNGYFELNTLMGRMAIGEPVPSSVVAEAARAFIVFSGLVVLPDHPDAYRAKGDLFNFIAQIRGSWDQTKVLDAKIGEYIVVARKKGDTWLVGAATNESARALDIRFDFLDEGEYEATIYSDDENASAFGNKEAYKISNQKISKGVVHHFKMAPGGGHAIMIRKK